MSRGLGSQEPTRPSREDRRREAERVQPAAAPPVAEATPPPPATAPAGTKLQARKRNTKVPFNTYLPPLTQQRVEWLRAHGGYTVTDIVDAALTEFLDKMKVPEDGDAK